jgi:hypothetical protein
MICSRGELRVIFIELILDSGPSLTLWRLQVLFHSLSKVLFIFRSRYLFAIGLPKIFSLSRGIPAISHCIPKQYYSEYKLCSQLLNWWKDTGLSPSMAPLSRRTYLSPNSCIDKIYHTPQFNKFKLLIRLGLFPLRSPLLGESLLFYFPPLNDMLKFSGWSTIIQALNRFC